VRGAEVRREGVGGGDLLGEGFEEVFLLLQGFVAFLSSFRQKKDFTE
jgi:hypothetical protein